MSISIICPGCKKNLKAPDQAGGRKLKCPQCGTAILVPKPFATEEEVEPIRTAERPSKGPKQFVLFLSLGLGVVIVAAAAVLVAVKLSSRPEAGQQAKVESPKKPDAEPVGHKDPPLKASSKEDHEKAILEARRKEEKARLEKEHQEKAASKKGENKPRRPSGTRSPCKHPLWKRASTPTPVSLAR